MIYKSDNIQAILGPTNTGKTYIAFEKIFSYSSGIFGFPLRLLARENYDKAVRKVGINHGLKAQKIKISSQGVPVEVGQESSQRREHESVEKDLAPAADS